MAKKAKPPTRAAGAKGTGAGLAMAAMSGLLGGGLSQIMPGQVRLNELKSTPLVVPKRKGKGR